MSAPSTRDEGSKLLLVTYVVVCVCLIIGLVAAMKSAMFLARNARNAKSIETSIASYEKWPESVREEFRPMLVQNGGRVKPAYTFARFTLLQMNNSSAVKFETRDGEKYRLSPDEWLLDVLFRGELAKDLPIFNVDDTEAVSGLGVLPKEGNKEHHKRDRYSYNQLLVARGKLAEEGRRISEKDANYQRSEKDPQYELTRIEGITKRLSQNVSLFEYLVGQFNVARNGEGLELREDLQVLAENFDAIGLMERVPQLTESQLMQFVQEPAPSPDEQTLQSAFQLYWFFANAGRYFQILPPKDPIVDEWVSVGDVLFQGLASRDSRPWAKGHLELLTTLVRSEKALWTGGDAAQATFVNQLGAFVGMQYGAASERKQARHEALSAELAVAENDFERERLETRQGNLKVEGAKAAREVGLYMGGAFAKSLVCFVFGFLVLALSWLVPGSKFARGITVATVLLLGLGLVFNVYGITIRSVIRSRPPITNLYDTIIFITGIAVFLALMIEFFTRRGIGLLLAAICGAGGMFLSIRYEVKEAVDTMDPLQAVLDTNLWLATHVTTINIGYAAGMLAAFLGVYYLLYRFLRPLKRVFRQLRTGEQGEIFHEDKESRDYAKTLVKMAYGIVCFCLFFSLIGTVLGGIWANYSWGRFWGWDPKENGALMICLWTLVILHMRLGGYAKDVGIAVLSVVLGVIVTFSWWGVNNLGVGLHSYGFTEGVWPALYVSWAEAGLIMSCGLPLWLHGQLQKRRKAASKLAQA